MLDLLRRSANKWFIKLLLFLVMSTFALWGILDMLIRPYGEREVARIGSESLSMDALWRATERLRSLMQRNRLKQPDYGKVVDLALQELTELSLVEQSIHSSGFIISDKSLGAIVRSIPEFQRYKKFDPQAFQDWLADNRISKSQFLTDTKSKMIRSRYIQPLLSGAVLPKAYLNCIIEQLYKPYVFTTVTLTLHDVPEPAAPLRSELEEFYRRHTENYVQKEVRNVCILYVNKNEMVDRIIVTDKDIDEYMESMGITVDASVESKKDAPAERSVQMLLFDNRIQAEKAAAQLRKNHQLLEHIAPHWEKAVYKEGVYKHADDAPSVGLNNIIATLKVGQDTGVVETADGYCIYQVTKIQQPGAASQSTADQAQKRESAASAIRSSRFDDTVKDWVDRVSDLLAAGGSIQDVAIKARAQTKTVSMHEQGYVSDGDSVSEWAPEAGAKIAKEAFSLDVGQNSFVIDLSDDVVGFVHLDGVTPKRTPAFDEVVSYVQSDWAQQAQERTLEEHAHTLLQAKNSTELESIAARIKCCAVVNKPVSRQQLYAALASKKGQSRHEDPIPLLLGLDGGTFDQLFYLQKGEMLLGHIRDGLVVVMLSSTLPPTISNKSFEISRNSISKAFEHDIMSLFLVALGKTYPIHIDHNMLLKYKDVYRQG